MFFLFYFFYDALKRDLDVLQLMNSAPAVVPALFCLP